MGGSDRDKGLRSVAIAILLAGSILLAGCAGTVPPSKTLKVIAAGSLLAPFAEAEQEFEASHPDIDVQIEGHGSIQVIRQVTDLGRTADVIAVADESLIPDLMYHPMKDSSRNYTDWYQPLSTNEMVIAYTNRSRYHDEINQENWYRILARPDVRLGFSNPMLDAAGYRSLMVLQLAEEEYSEPLLFETLVTDHFPSTITVSSGTGGTTISLPEIMRPSDEKVVIRDGSIYLLSLLSAGGIDYAIEYRSVAEGMNLSYVTLPPSIHLGSAEYADRYRDVTVILGFPRFATIGSERNGRPIVYAVTVPANAPNPDLALEFIGYIANESAKGRPGWPAPLPEGAVS
ncbi:MAG TPA: tungstate ABC transporter substrate-binding protein WtpA [Methanoregulaceae archaeon]|jgi:molybdate/tungstate transport system substrate-binding protein|nr:tungstate ABC transporter substrate-binding protein WtpA [Burkholderiaceae bacterium]NLH26280.1 tungstate ABC transporter substrate-binding protein WtpA [Methanomicrobiales archaeon]HNB03860.1 tungstate ABC transporter substrate-binding protein WtpA [Methanoregulaceae archaeon]HNJ81775.1 tungstate ABC transporter substrate-binding protein WtpA [Methanoregulaceae archaeon]HNL86127.1 tungstate ABC transporter substrate-binding protein WtpA [Methanoregulaceae archaeon]